MLKAWQHLPGIVLLVMRKPVENIFSRLLRKYHTRQYTLCAEALNGDAWSGSPQHTQVRYHLRRHRQVYCPFVGWSLACQFGNPAARSVRDSLIVRGIVRSDARLSVAHTADTQA